MVMAGVSVEYMVMPADLRVDALRKLLPPRLVRSMRSLADFARADTSASDLSSRCSSAHSLAVSNASSIVLAVALSSLTFASAFFTAASSCLISSTGASWSFMRCSDWRSALASPFACDSSSWTFCHLSDVSCMYFGMFLCSASTPDRRPL